MKNDKYIQAELFEAFIKASDDFRILRTNKRKTYFTIKPISCNNKETCWSYIVNFDYGTIRRIVALKYKKKRKKYVNKFAYYCNKKNKILPGQSIYSYYYDCYIKINDHLEMYRKLLEAEKRYKPKNKQNMLEVEDYKYGITSI